MVDHGIGTFVRRVAKTRGKVYEKFYIHLPKEVVRDSAFPLQIRRKLSVEQVGKELVIASFQNTEGSVGKIIVRPSKGYPYYYLYLPKKLVLQDEFPFETNQRVQLRIVGAKLHIAPLE